MTLDTLPESWAVAPLNDIALVIQGQSPPGESYNSDGVGLPFFQGKAEFGTITPKPSKWCTQPRKIAEANDVLISVRAPVGPTNLAAERCAIGRGLAAIRPLDDIPARFILFYLRQSAQLLVDKATGSTFEAIAGDTLRAHPIAIAPISEQHRIVEAIDSYLTRLDDSARTLERVQRNLKRYRASVLNAAVEGRLVPTEAELSRAEGRDYEPASLLLERILAERRQRWEEDQLSKMNAKGKSPKGESWKAKYDAPMPPDIAELPELAEGWCWTTIDALTIFGPQNGVYVPQSQYGTGTPILRIDDYQMESSRSSSELRRIAIHPDAANAYGLRTGDIVINRVNSPSHLGKALSVGHRHLPAVFESNMMRLGLARGVAPAYIQHYLSSPTASSRSSGPTATSCGTTGCRIRTISNNSPFSSSSKWPTSARSSSARSRAFPPAIDGPISPHRGWKASSWNSTIARRCASLGSRKECLGSFSRKPRTRFRTRPSFGS
jgi:type I restriction enzyme S subunit